MVYGFVEAAAWLAPDAPEPILKPTGPHAIWPPVDVGVHETVALLDVVATVTSGTKQGDCVATKATLSTCTSYDVANGCAELDVKLST